MTDPFSHTVQYQYDTTGKLIYPDGRVVTYTYNMDNRLVQVEDWQGEVTMYAYDGIGRLITTTLPNQVIAQNSYDAAHHLTQLRYTGPGETLLADFQYQVDGLGQRQVVTETLLNPAYEEVVAAFVAADGLLVLEAEKDLVTPGLNGQTWVSQTVQSGYSGESYLRALPDTGQLYEVDELDDSPQLTYPIYAPETADYTVWIRGMAADSAGDSLHLGLNGQAVVDTTRLTGFDNQEWQWQSLTMSNTQPVLSLEAGADSLNIWMREDGLRIDRLLLVTDTNYIPTGSGPTASSLQLITHTVPAQQNSHVIHYSYDPLNRLTEATYSGDINAEYDYAYDPVGNMTAYTQTVTSTTTVTRTFDAANRLESSGDGSGTSSYSYDGNGNLLEIDRPGISSDLRYGYNQRNLMISHTLSISGTSPQLQATYSYDGRSNRTQQVDYSGATPITTTYTNDIMGLSQVLVADNGSNQTHMLYGLDLISQDDGDETRYLLADGLGSVRVEMVDDAIATATTYAPFGSLLQQAGTSGTVYGFTGEQYDSSTNQLYLRARYYNPTLHTLMGKDPWSGAGSRPQSMNGWSYVDNNPISLVDPTGMVPSKSMFPDFCRTEQTKATYVICVADAFRVETDWGKLLLHYYTGTSHDKDFDDQVNKVKGGPGCYSGPVPYRGPGYYEGIGGVISPLSDNLFEAAGTEIAYDFVTFEGSTFTYQDYFHFSDTLLGFSFSEYSGAVEGFKSWTGIVKDYEGDSWVASKGLGLNFLLEIPISYGSSGFTSRADSKVKGSGYYLSGGIGADILPIAEVSFGIATFTPKNAWSYVLNDGSVDRITLIRDIMQGKHSPWETNFILKLSWFFPPKREDNISKIYWYAWVYESMQLAE